MAVKRRDSEFRHPELVTYLQGVHLVLRAHEILIDKVKGMKSMDISVPVRVAAMVAAAIVSGCSGVSSPGAGGGGRRK